MIEGQAIDQNDSGGGGGMGWVFNHLPAILWHRRYYVIGAFLLLFLAAVITAFMLPTLYRSSATFLVQSQQLPTDIVEAPGAGQIEERIAKIRERVLSRGDLISLIEQYNLYPSERRSEPMSVVVEKMRTATMVGAMSNDIGDSRGKSDVIAVTMSFDYPEPAQAQSVMQSYVSRFLQMDSESVEDQANLTVRFLQDQAAKLQGQIQQIEGALTGLKARNGSALANSGVPSFMDTGGYTAQIANLENQNRQLLAQSRTPSAGNPELAQAEAALAAARATYSDSHPDVVQARERLEALRRIVGNSSGPDPAAAIQEQIRANNAAIASLTAARNSAMARVSSAMAGQARAPAILEQAMQLENRANTLREQYRATANELLKAQNSARLANEQRAERLSLVEPPSLPDRPHWPNRTLMIAGGAAAGLLLGLILALGIELVARPMRSPKQVQGMGLPVLGVVPVLQPEVRPKRFQFFRKRVKRFA